MHELQVEGMSCNHCVSKVTKSVRGIDPNAKVEVDLTGKKVRVNSDRDLDDVSSAIEEAGYAVQSGKTI